MFRRAKFATFWLLVFQISCWGQQPATTQKPLAPGAALRKTIGFLRVEFLKDAQIWNAYGTGFFVFFEDKRLGENRGFGYLVTNRHVAEPQENGHKFTVGRTFLRLNLQHAVQGQESSERPIVTNESLHWYFPLDDSVDLAAFPFNPEEVDIQSFPVSMFATRDVVESSLIAEGDLVLYTGYFSNFPGLKRVQPIVREGVLAMMPDELMETTLHRPRHLYLADIHVFEGNSGGPLFVSIGGYRNGSVLLSGGFPYRLLGVVSGFFTEDTDLKLVVATALEGKVKGNSGIAAVVPVDELKALLDLPTLQKLRDEEVARQVPKKN